MSDEGDVVEQPQSTIQIHRDKNMRLIPISEVSARVLAGLCDTVVGKGSAAKFQIAIAQQEIEAELANLDKQDALQPDDWNGQPNRAERRAVAHHSV